MFLMWCHGKTELYFFSCIFILFVCIPHSSQWSSFKLTRTTILIACICLKNVIELFNTFFLKYSEADRADIIALIFQTRIEYL